MRSHRRCLRLCRPFGALLALAAAFVCAAAQAVGLGAIVQQSSLGQPLRLVVEVIALPGEELLPECFRLATTAHEADGIPRIGSARVTLERTPAGAQLVVASPRPVRDPIVRVAVQAGCEQSMRRDYTLLLDPPVIDLPAPDPQALAEAPATSPPAPEAAPAPAPSPRSTAGSSLAGSKKAEGPRSATRRSSAQVRALARRQGAAPAANAAPATKATVRRAASAKAAPRLKISGASAPAEAAAIAAVNRMRREAQVQTELAQALEAEIVVLHQRVVELSGMVERMQQEARAAAAARLAAEEAAKASRLVIDHRSGDANGLVLAVIVGVAALIAGSLVWRRRQVPVPANKWPIAYAPPAPAVRRR